MVPSLRRTLGAELTPGKGNFKGKGSNLGSQVWNTNLLGHQGANGLREGGSHGVAAQGSSKDVFVLVGILAVVEHGPVVVVDEVGTSAVVGQVAVPVVGEVGLSHSQRCRAQCDAGHG